jgi:hypothetical protein
VIGSFTSVQPANRATIKIRPIIKVILFFKRIFLLKNLGSNDMSFKLYPNLNG